MVLKWVTMPPRIWRILQGNRPGCHARIPNSKTKTYWSFPNISFKIGVSVGRSARWANSGIWSRWPVLLAMLSDHLCGPAKVKISFLQPWHSHAKYITADYLDVPLFPNFRGSFFITCSMRSSHAIFSLAVSSAGSALLTTTNPSRWNNRAETTEKRYLKNIKFQGWLSCRRYCGLVLALCIEQNGMVRKLISKFQVPGHRLALEIKWK